jgi:hypothetical protein
MLLRIARSARTGGSGSCELFTSNPLCTLLWRFSRCGGRRECGSRRGRSPTLSLVTLVAALLIPLPCLSQGFEPLRKFEDWQLNQPSPSGNVRYFTGSMLSDAYQFGFVLSPDRCSEPTLWMTWTLNETGLRDLIDKRISILIHPNESRFFQNTATVTNVTELPDGRTTLTIKRFDVPANDLVEGLDRSFDVKVEILGLQDVLGKIQNPQSRFPLSEFSYVHSEAMSLCLNSNETIATYANRKNEAERLARNYCANAPVEDKAREQLTDIQRLAEPVAGSRWELGEAVAFALRIKEAAENRDLEGLYALIDDQRFQYGPSRSFVQGKDFSAVFPDEWRANLLDAEIPCAPYWFRSNLYYSVGGVRYQRRMDEPSFYIESISGADWRPNTSARPPEPTPEVAKWSFNGIELGPACFAYESISGDNYQYLHETFAPSVAYRDFVRNIGRYVGREVPLEPSGYSSGGYDLAAPVSQCSAQSTNMDYEVLRRLDTRYCATLAPNLAQGCEELALVAVGAVKDCGVTGLGCRLARSTTIYGIVRDLEADEDLVVPLATPEDPPSFVDQLESNDAANADVNSSEIARQFSDLFGLPSAICYVYYRSAISSLAGADDLAREDPEKFASLLAESASFRDSFAFVLKIAYKDDRARLADVLTKAKLTLEMLLAEDQAETVREQMRACPKTLKVLADSSDRFAGTADSVP